MISNYIKLFKRDGLHKHKHNGFENDSTMSNRIIFN